MEEAVGFSEIGIFCSRNKLQCCECRQTWESAEKKSVLDYMLFGKGLDVIMMVDEDSGNLEYWVR